MTHCDYDKQIILAIINEYAHFIHIFCISFLFQIILNNNIFQRMKFLNNEKGMFPLTHLIGSENKPGGVKCRRGDESLKCFPDDLGKSDDLDKSSFTLLKATFLVCYPCTSVLTSFNIQFSFLYLLLCYNSVTWLAFFLWC